MLVVALLVLGQLPVHSPLTKPTRTKLVEFLERHKSVSIDIDRGCAPLMYIHLRGDQTFTANGCMGHGCSTPEPLRITKDTIAGTCTMKTAGSADDSDGHGAYEEVMAFELIVSGLSDG